MSLKTNWCIVSWWCHSCWQFGPHTWQMQGWEGNGSQQSWSNLETSSVMLPKPNWATGAIHPPKGHTRRHLVAAILAFQLQPLPNDLQQTIEKKPNQWTTQSYHCFVKGGELKLLQLWLGKCPEQLHSAGGLEWQMKSESIQWLVLQRMNSLR